MNGLYAICDLDFLAARGVDPLGYAQALLAAAPATLQLRAKNASAPEVVALLRRLAALCTTRGTALFANDRPDLALAAGAHGVHVGQTDLAIAEVRRFDPSLRVGLSTHTLSQLEEGLRQRPDYVAFGPVFATTSKQDPDAAVGLSGLAQASSMARSCGIALVAIGGIGLHHLPEVAPLVDQVAVISGLFPQPPPVAPAALFDAVTQMARRYHAAFHSA